MYAEHQLRQEEEAFDNLPGGNGSDDPSSDDDQPFGRHNQEEPEPIIPQQQANAPEE